MQTVFMISACVSVLAVALICVFLFANGIPAMGKIGFFDFLCTSTWKPENDIYGIFPIIIGVPIGLLTAVFMARFCPPWLYKIMKPAINLLAGIPSVVYGFFGLMV